MDDLFGSDDDEEEQISQSTDFTIEKVCAEAYIELMHLKPTTTTTFSIPDVQSSLPRKVVIVTDGFIESAVKLRQRLDISKFKDVIVIDKNELIPDIDSYIDVVVSIDIRIDDTWFVSITDKLIAGGLLLVNRSITSTDGMPGQEVALHSKKHISQYANYSLTSDSSKLASIRVYYKKSVSYNPTATVYWSPIPAEEQHTIDQITLNLTSSERKYRLFSDDTHIHAVDILKEYGVCIFKGLFPPGAVNQWGQAAVEDMKQVLVKLRKNGIDLFATRADFVDDDGDPAEGPEVMIENYHEMSMREARRCDLRNGTCMKALSAETNREPEASELPTSTSVSSSADLRSHQGLMAVLTEVASPEGGEAAAGNWGRWNFEGAGPDGPPPPLTVGSVGAVMSLPGCVDQTIHADTSHLYVHTQLPGHYFNLFLPATTDALENSGHDVGQTAFVVGSHKLQVSYDVMVSPQGNEELHRRLIRPHLQIGDALVFDCRALHLGLANRSAYHEPPYTEDASQVDTRGWRPLLYINYHQPWFVDPKNWNNKVRLFDS